MHHVRDLPALHQFEVQVVMGPGDRQVLHQLLALVAELVCVCGGVEG